MSLTFSIQKTLLYHHRFSSPLTEDEIHLLLVSDKLYSLNLIKKALASLLANKTILQKENYYYLSGLNYLPLPNPKYYKEKLNLVKNLIPVLKKIPFLNLLAITGSVASKKPHSNTDIDLLLLSRPNTLWILRPLFLFTLHLKKTPFHQALKKEKKNYLCPNIILDSSSQTIPKNRQSLTSATDLILMIPVFNRGNSYYNFLKKNSWAQKYLKNGYQQKLAKSKLKTKNQPQTSFLSIFNPLFFITQYLYMLPKIKNESVSLKQVFFNSKKQ